MSASDREPSQEKTDLAERIRAAQKAHEPSKNELNVADKYNHLTLAWRMTLELVIGTAIGCAMGWGLDSLFGTDPLFLLIFGALGFAAGVKVLMETAREVGERAKRKSDLKAQASDDQ